MSKRFDDGDWVQITSKFHFVDLAGSERVSLKCNKVGVGIMNGGGLDRPF